jgi:hypothetical protein
MIYKRAGINGQAGVNAGAQNDMIHQIAVKEHPQQGFEFNATAKQRMEAMSLDPRFLTLCGSPIRICKCRTALRNLNLLLFLMSRRTLSCSTIQMHNLASSLS